MAGGQEELTTKNTKFTKSKDNTTNAVAQHGDSEINQQASAKACRFQIGDQLRFVNLVEVSHSL